jgi:Glycosyltransferase family 87
MLQAVGFQKLRCIRGLRLLDRATLVWIAVAASAALGFLLSWSVLQQTAGHHQLRDTPLYEAYADAIRAGDLPYRNFVLEYPPGALAAFVVPSISASPEHFASYNTAFERWMALCGAAMMVAMAGSLAALGASPRRAAAALGLAAASPLLLGSVILTRFDLWPAALTAVAVVSLLWGYRSWAAIIFGLAIAAKLYPLVCVPIALAWVWRRHGRHAAALWATLLVGVLAAAFVPFAVLAPRGLEHSFTFQLFRPLQIESLGAAVLVTAHWMAGLPLLLHNDHGSTNIVGLLPSLVGYASAVCEIVLIVRIWFLFARGPATQQRLILAMAAAVTTFVAFGKVFSPQYLVWLIPLLPLVAGRRGLTVCCVFAGSLLVTRAWFPARYGDYVYGLRITQSVEVFVRDLAVAACALLLTRWLVAGPLPRVSGRSVRLSYPRLRGLGRDRDIGTPPAF